MEYLALVTKTSDGYAANVPELSVILANADTIDELRATLPEMIADFLQEHPDAPEPQAKTLADLPKKVQESYAGLEVHELLVAPALTNPVSAQIAAAIEASGLTYREVARRMETSHAAVSRMADPFYWGHSLQALRRLATALDWAVDFQLVKPVEVPQEAYVSHHFGGMRLPAHLTLNHEWADKHVTEFPMVVKMETGKFRLNRPSPDRWQRNDGSITYDAVKLA